MAAEALEKRFTAYVDALASALAHADRKPPFAAYCRGLILPGQRKSIEPMAARIRPERGAPIAAPSRRQGGLVG